MGGEAIARVIPDGNAGEVKCGGVNYANNEFRMDSGSVSTP